MARSSKDSRPANVKPTKTKLNSDSSSGPSGQPSGSEELTLAYILESSYELQALASLIETQCVAGTLEVLVRAVLERTGRITWILDSSESASAKVRGLRAAFEWNVCLYFYRRAIESVGTNQAIKAIRKDNQNERQLLEQWFKVEKESNDPCNPDSGPTSDISKWTLDGERYPNYTQLAHWILAEGTIGKKKAGGTYAGLSSFSHPNFIASREARTVEGSTVSYTYGLDYTERLIRLALFSFCYTLKRWASYYDANFDALAAETDSVIERWDALDKVDLGPSGQG